MTSYYTCFMMCFNKNIIRNSGNVNGYNFVNCSNEGLLTTINKIITHAIV